MADAYYIIVVDARGDPLAPETECDSLAVAIHVANRESRRFPQARITIHDTRLGHKIKYRRIAGG